MQSLKLGKVTAPIQRARKEWDVDTEYLNNKTYVDTVMRNGNGYICVNESGVSVGVDPATDIAETDWRMIVERGGDGQIDSNSVIDFNDYSSTVDEDLPTPLTSLGKIVSGNSLALILEGIKGFLRGSFLKLLKKFSDTEHTATGASITYDSSNDSKALITKITGATTVTRPNMSSDVSVENPQTFTDAQNFSVIANNGSGTSNSFSYTGTLGALTEGSSVVNTIEYNADTGVTELVERWKSVTFNGSENWIIHPNQPSDTTLTRFHLFYSTSKINGDISSNLFVKGDYTATKESIYIHNTTAYVNVIIKKSRITGWSDSLTDAQKNNLYKSFLSTTNLIVRYELATPIRTTLTTKPALTTYEGTTNIFTTASPQVSMDVDFKSRFWDLQNKKIDTSKILQSKNITQNGYLIDGKTASDEFASINDALINIRNPLAGVNIAGNYVYSVDTDDKTKLRITLNGTVSHPRIFVFGDRNGFPILMVLTASEVLNLGYGSATYSNSNGVAVLTLAPWSYVTIVSNHVCTIIRE